MGPRESFFLEIPVYRCTEDQYQKEIDEEEQEWIEHFMSYKMTLEESRNVYYTSVHPGAWRFNQIIGYLRLYVESGRDAVKAEYWQIQQSRIPRIQGKKKFTWRTWREIETRFSKSDSSETIYAKLLEALMELQKEEKSRKRYIDITYFQELGPFVNWRAYLDS